MIHQWFFINVEQALALMNEMLGYIGTYRSVPDSRVASPSQVGELISGFSQLAWGPLLWKPVFLSVYCFLPHFILIVFVSCILTILWVQHAGDLPLPASGPYLNERAHSHVVILKSRCWPILG